MKIPKRIIECVAAPLLASAALACSSSSPNPPPPEPAPIAPQAVVEVAPDPVSYDAVAEAARLSRTDEVLAAAETERDVRIEDEEAAAERRRARGALGILGRNGGIGTIGVIGPNDHWMNACGRG